MTHNNCHQMMYNGAGSGSLGAGHRSADVSLQCRPCSGACFYFCRHDVFSKVVRRIPNPFTARRQSVTENCECIWPHKETTLEKKITDDIYIYRKYINGLTKQRLRKGSRHKNIKKKLFFLSHACKLIIPTMLYYAIYFYVHFCIF